MQQELSIAICEDIRDDADSLLIAIQDSGVPARTVVFESVESLFETFRQEQYHIIFFDIYLSGLNGLEGARLVREFDESCEIVFVTLSRDHAVEAFELNAHQYLTKPVSQQRVKIILLTMHNRNTPSTCRIVADRKVVDIAYRDIIYAEVYGRHCLIHTNKGTFKPNIALSSLEKMLPDPQFLRCHRSYLVNMDRVRELNDDFVMCNGDLAYIRKTDAKQIKSRYQRFLMERCMEGNNL